MPVFLSLFNNIIDKMNSERSQKISILIKKILPLELFNIIQCYDYYFIGKEIIYKDLPHITSIAVYKDVKIIIGLNNGGLQLFDIENKKIERIFEGHNDRITCITSCKNKIVTGSYDNTIKIWNLNSPYPQLILSGHTGFIVSIIILGEQIISGSWDKSIKIWDSNTGECKNTLLEHIQPIACLNILPDNKMISADGNSIKIWNLDNFACLVTLPDKDGIIKMNIISDNLISVITSNDKLAIYNIKEQKYDLLLEGHNNHVIAMMSLGNNEIITVSYDKTLKIWDLLTGKCIFSIIEGNITEDVITFSISKYGYYIINASIKNEIHLIN